MAELLDLLSDRVMDNTGSAAAFSMARSLFRPMKKWRVSVMRSVKAVAVIFSGDSAVSFAVVPLLPVIERRRSAQETVGRLEMELEGLWIGLLDRHIEEEGVCEGCGHWLWKQGHVREEGTHDIYASQPCSSEHRGRRSR